MAIKATDELFKRVVGARTPAEVGEILKDLGDSPTAGLDKPFGLLACRWVAYGRSESNESTIGLAGKAGRSLTERITNSVDALLELEKERCVGEPPKSPSAAAEKWYGRPATGPGEGLFRSEDKEGNLSRSIAVVLCDSDVVGAPTVDVIDTGIGLDPAEMPDTILSLQEGNKVKKPYLVGRFGQGGASTLAFCDYAIVISRDHEASGAIGFTIIRLVNPGEDYELDVYAYLTVDGKIPSVGWDEPLFPYADTKLKHPPELAYGTIVRHIGFKLLGLDNILGSSPGNLYHFLHLSMFDPLFPFRVLDIRGGRAMDERVGGSRNRLMRYVERGETESDIEAGRISLIHHQEMEYIVPLNSSEHSIGVEYWVIQAKRKDKDELRSSSNELFVQRAYPIVATLNGQNQGELPAKFLKDLGLGMVSKHIVVHIDTSRAHRSTRRQLFTTTREGFKEGPELDNLTKTLARILKDDARLAEIEQELTDRLVNRDSRATSENVKKQITRLLREAGFSTSAQGDTDVAGPETGGGGGGGGGSGGGGRGGGGSVTLALATKPFPDVTKWDIVSPADKVRVRMDGRALLRVETDADSRFDHEGLIRLEFEPEKVEIASVSALRGGRKQWRLRPAEGGKVGDNGTIIAVLRTPNGGELRSATQFEVLAPIGSGDMGRRGRVPDFEVLPINPDKDEDTARWNQLWPDHENASRLVKAHVAYKVLSAGDKTIVYYSTAFGPYVERVERLKSKSAALAAPFEENYLIWIGYHAILQLPDEQKAAEDQQESLEAERCRVAQVQLRIAEEMAEMQRKVARAAETAEV